MTTTPDIRLYEEASLAGLPALCTDGYDGWLLRFAKGHSRRANSVAPLYPSTIDVGEKIRYCETAYARAGLRCVFKMTDASTPHGLDDQLADAGYQRDAETLVCTWQIAGNVVQPRRVELTATPSADWLATWSRLSERPDEGVFSQLLAATPTAAAYVLIRHKGRGIACARATMSAGLVGLYDLLVAPGHRRQGLATDLTLARLWWAQSQGVSRAFLQVMAGNTGAQTLQRRLGFAEIYRYWYRLQP